MTRSRHVRHALIAAAIAASACRAPTPEAARELQRERSGTLDVVLLSERDALRQGTDTFVIEFRSAANGALIDAGDVRGSATMPMGGTPMFGMVDIVPTDVPGRYSATGNLSMAGTWRLTVEGEGPAGKGTVTFPASVQ